MNQSIIYPPVTYIFDFDDTLMWAPKWFSESEIDKDGKLISAEQSCALKSALDFLSKLKQNPRSIIRSDLNEPLPQWFQDVTLWAQKINKPEMGKSDATVFVLKNKQNKLISIEEMKKFFSRKTLDKAFIDVSGRLVDHPAITDDYLFYRKPETIGTLGPNWEIFNLYLKHNDKAVILTAREESPGIQERILELIKEYGGKPPIRLFTKPPDPNFSSAKYKSIIILDIVTLPQINKIYFYDDNLKYTLTVAKSLTEYDIKHGTSLAKKVEIIPVDVKNKPQIKPERLSRFKTLDKYK